MIPARLSVRFPAEQAPLDLEPAIAVFHRFIQRGLVEGRILDVADYRHVPTGPGVMLIGHDVDYGVDPDGFTVVRKRSTTDTAATQLRDALRMGLGALDALADDGALDATFDPSRWIVTVPDRSLGPAAEVAADLRAETEQIVAELFGPDATVTTLDSDDPRRAAAVRVETAPAAADGLLDALGGSRAPGQSPWDIRVEDLARLREQDPDVVLLDVREESEYETVNLGGTHLPLAVLDDRLDELEPDRQIVVHCRAGRRGAKAVEQLRDAGFDDVWNLNGGLMAWIDRIDPSLQRY